MRRYYHLFLKQLRAFVLWSAQALYRSPQEDEGRGSKNDMRRKILLIAFLFAIILGFYGSVFLAEYKKWDNLSPEIVVPKSAFKILYLDSPSCSEIVDKNSSCFANPSQPALWQSPQNLGDAEHHDLVRERKEKTYWIGLKLDSEVLESAYQRKLNHLYLGTVNADYKIWVQGVLYVHGIADRFQDVFISLPYDILTKASPIYIAIQVTHNRGSDYPDNFNMGEGEGLTSREHIDILQSRRVFTGGYKNIAAATAEFLFTFLFLYFWISTPRKQEYFFVALLAIVSFANFLDSIEILRFQMHRSLSYTLDVLIYSYEALALILLTLSFARSRKIFLWLSFLVIGVVVPSFLLITHNTRMSLVTHVEFIAQWIVPGACWIGAIVCIIQAMALGFDEPKGSKRKRIIRLLSFALIVSFLGLNFFVQASGISSPIVSVTAYKFSQFFLILMMSIIVLSDYRNTTQGYAKAINEIDELEQKLSQQEVHAKIGEISRQVAHDIRSPLSALNMLSSSLKEISEEKRLILRTATQRINDIANELLQKSKFDLNLNITEANTKTPILSDSLSPKNLEPIMISALLDTIVSEKRVQYSRRGEIDIHADLTQGYGLFAKIEPSALARVVSNLINNSVEAIPSSGYVRLALTGTKDQILISVKDNGEGIAPTLLSKLGHEGASFGKKGEQSGFGLGLVHARKVLEEAGGQLLIESNLGHGTTISLILPKASTPTWFVDFIALPRHAVVVSVDDDLTIHQIWSGRFSSLDQSSSKVKPMAFTSIDKFEDWLAHNKTLPTLFLIDYEFIGQGMNGIDVIQRNGIADRAVLVTSRYEEPAIKELAKALKIKLLPKGLAPVVPIIIEKSFPS